MRPIIRYKYNCSLDFTNWICLLAGPDRKQTNNAIQSRTTHDRASDEVKTQQNNLAGKKHHTLTSTMAQPSDPTPTLSSQISPLMEI